MEISAFWKKYGTIPIGRRVWICMIVGLLLGAYRLRYFVDNQIPLGYDPGMYKGIFDAYSNILRNFDFSQLPGWVRHEPLLGIIMAILGKLGANFDWRLTRGIGIINIIPGILIFVLLKKENKRMGVIAAWLYWVSIAAYQVFWRGYFKQIIAVNLLLLILICIQNRKFIWQWILFFLIIILHKHTALYTGAILFGYGILERYNSKKFPQKQALLWISAGIIGLIVYIPLWNQIMTEAIKASGTIIASQTAGDFMTRIQYIGSERLIIILSVLGILWKGRKKEFDVLSIGYIIGAVWLLLGIVNYNRTIVFFDIFVVIFAAYGIWYSYLHYKSFGFILLGLISLATGFNYINHINNNAYPLISQEEFKSINDLPKKTGPNAIIMTTHKNYTPRVMGRSQLDYINPGMADLDKWTHKEWIQRRSFDGSGKCTMLKNTYQKLNRPMFIWIGEQQIPEDFAGGNCLRKVDWGTTRSLWVVDFTLT